MRPTKFGRELIFASGLPGTSCVLSNSEYFSAAGAVSSAPAEKPTAPIFAGSSPQSIAYARTILIACSMSFTASTCEL